MVPFCVKLCAGVSGVVSVQFCEEVNFKILEVRILSPGTFLARVFPREVPEILFSARGHAGADFYFSPKFALSTLGLRLDKRCRRLRKH